MVDILTTESCLVERKRIPWNWPSGSDGAWLASPQGWNRYMVCWRTIVQRGTADQIVVSLRSQINLNQSAWTDQQDCGHLFKRLWPDQFPLIILFYLKEIIISCFQWSSMTTANGECQRIPKRKREFLFKKLSTRQVYPLESESHLITIYLPGIVYLNNTMGARGLNQWKYGGIRT